MKYLDTCPCCNDKECFTWREYHRTGKILKRTVPVNAKYKIGDKVWVSISHNGDFREET